MLPLLSFFPTGNLTPEALQVVGLASIASCLPDSDDDTEPDLTWLTHGRDQLVAAGLLEYDRSRDIYTFHQAILDEANRHRAHAEVSGAITIALLQHYADYVHANRSNNEMLDRCFENTMTLMESLWSARDKESSVDVILASFVQDFAGYFQLRGFWQLGQSWHERAIELRRTSSHAQDERSLAHELYQQAQLMAGRGDLGNARAALNECLSLYEKAGNQQGIGGALYQLAIIESAQGNPSEARRLLQRSLAILESLGDQLGLSASLYQLAMIEAAQGNTIEARKLWEKSVSLEEAIGNVAGAATTRCMLAQLEAMDGQFEKAISLARSAVQVFEKLGHTTTEQARGILRHIESLAAEQTK